MKHMKRVLWSLVSSGVLMASAVVAQEAPQKPREEAPKQEKAAVPSREQFRKELEGLTPEQRSAKMKEMRERMQNNPELQKQREEFNNLTPEQREAKLKEFRERASKAQNLTPEQREAKTKEFRERMETRRVELEKKKKDGSITAEEEKQLERFNTAAKRGAEGKGKQPEKKAE